MVVKLSQKLQEKSIVEKKFLETLVPVYYKFKKPMSEIGAFIFWYVPNKEFLDAIPKKYADQIRLELEAMRKHEELGIPLHEACRGIDNTNSIFGLCRLTSGTINLTRLSPNPAGSQMSCEFDLSEERTVTINIHDITGRFVGNVVKNQKYGSGINTVDIDLSKFSASQFYLLSITTDKGEVVSQRFFMK